MSEYPLDRDPPPAAAETAPGLRASANPPVAGRRLALLCGLTLGCVILADWLFWQHPRGWTIGGYGLVLTGMIFVWRRTVPRGRAVLLVTLAVAALCLQCFEEPTWLVVACGLLGLATLAIIVNEGWSASAVVWARRWARLAAMGWQGLFKDAAGWYRRRRAGGDLARSGSRFVRNWSIAILLGAVFLALFAVANPVMSRWLSEAWREFRGLFTRLFEQFPSGWRLLMWALVGIGVWGLLRFRSGVGASARRESATGDIPWPEFPSPEVVVRCLVLFNVLFALQTALDVYYLWGGGELPKGLTHAQYAHRGAYPLVAAALLAALFVLAAFRSRPRQQKMRVARRLVCVWLVQNLFLVVSAAWRLRLYVEAYTLTRWRVAAALWMLLVLCGLLWILLRIIGGRSSLWLINVNTVTALVVLYACSFVDFDGWIAGFNVAHCQEVRGHGPAIDLAYLESLGPDTLPALLRLVGEVRSSPKAATLHETIVRLRGELEDDLRCWRGWTWRRQRLQSVDHWRW